MMLLDGKILAIRPKMWMANDGNYRELRYFTPWARRGETDEFVLPRIIKKITGQVSVCYHAVRRITIWLTDASFWPCRAWYPLETR